MLRSGADRPSLDAGPCSLGRLPNTLGKARRHRAMARPAAKPDPVLQRDVSSEPHPCTPHEAWPRSTSDTHLGTGTGMPLPDQQALLTWSSLSPGRARRVPSSWVLSASRTSPGLGRPRSPLADAQRVSLTQTWPPNPWIGAPLITGQAPGHQQRRPGSPEGPQAERSTTAYDGPAPTQPR